MKLIREHRIFRYFWLLLALHFINGSVDPVDFNLNDYAAEDLSLNEMETIAEIVAEQILDIENCFPEYDEPFDDSNIPLKPVKQLSQYLPPAPPAIKTLQPISKKLNNFLARFFNSQFSPEIVPPPPRHFC